MQIWRGIVEVYAIDCLGCCTSTESSIQSTTVQILDNRWYGIELFGAVAFKSPAAGGAVVAAAMEEAKLTTEAAA